MPTPFEIAIAPLKVALLIALSVVAAVNISAAVLLQMVGRGD
jgi:hypothetical protein